jgi:H+/Cl- antiporter ClcA
VTDSGSDGPADPIALLTSRAYVVLLVFAAGVGLLVSLAAWCFLELVHQAQQGVFTDLPRDLGYQNGAPDWWYLLVLGLAGVIAAFAIARLPGRGGHIPAFGLTAGGTPQPITLPGVVLAALATLCLGVVLGPEAPLIALGGGLGVLALRSARRDAPDQTLAVVAAAGSFAAISFIFDSPLIAAVLLIEATGLGGPKLPVILLPGLLAAGIGSLVSIGMGAWTGLSTSAYALGALPVPDYPRPTFTGLLWTFPLAAAVAVGTFGIVWLARGLVPIAARRPFLVTPAAGLVVAALAILFAATTDKGASEVLFSGQDQLPGLVSGAATWSVGALLLVLLFKGLAWSASLATFRGGPTFPAMFLGAAAGVAVSHLGMALTPAAAVGIGAGLASMLRLPLSAVLLAVVLTSATGIGASPLVVVGVVVAYLTTLLLSRVTGFETRGREDEAKPHDGERAAAAGKEDAAAPADRTSVPSP